MIERAMPKSTSFTVPTACGVVPARGCRVARQHDVRRLEVAMEDAAPVRRGEPGRGAGETCAASAGVEPPARA